MNLYDKDGKEVEAVSKKEHEEKLEESKKEVRSEVSDKIEKYGETQKELEQATEKIGNLEGDIEKLTGKIEDGNVDDGQKKRLKKEREDAKTELDDYKTEMNSKFESIQEKLVGRERSNKLEELSGGDSEVKDKIEKEMGMFSDEAISELDPSQVVEKAAKIVHADSPIPSFSDNLVRSNTRGDRQEHKQHEAENENSKGMRKVLGISDKDVEKYGEDN